MTWRSFFDLSTMQSRHLLAAYAVVFIVQIGYLARILWQWNQTKAPRR